jgi:hypothetical protein
MIVTYRPTRNSVHATPAIFAVATPDTKARRHHAVASSTAAHAIAVTPSGVLCSRRSVRMRASTGNAVTDIDTPMNNENTVNEMPRCE